MMKKIASLLLTVVLLATMLTVFAVPAFAAPPGVTELTNATTIEGTKTFDEKIVANCNVTVERNSSVTFTGEFTLKNGYTFTVESGATVIFNQETVFYAGSALILEDGASVIFDKKLSPRDGVTIEGKGTVTCKGKLDITSSGSVTVKNGASVICDGNVCLGATDVNVEIGSSLTCNNSFEATENSTVNVEAGAKLAVDNDDWSNAKLCTLNIHGIMTGYFEGEHAPNIHIFPGGTLDIMLADSMDVDGLSEQLQAECPNTKCQKIWNENKYHLTAHMHFFDENGTCCGQEVLYGTDDDGTDLGSTLSEGSLTIIVGIAAAVVFGLGGFFIGKAAGKKKKPAVAGAAESDE